MILKYFENNSKNKAKERKNIGDLVYGYKHFLAGFTKNLKSIHWKDVEEVYFEIFSSKLVSLKKYKRNSYNKSNYKEERQNNLIDCIVALSQFHTQKVVHNDISLKSFEIVYNKVRLMISENSKIFENFDENLNYNGVNKIQDLQGSFKKDIYMLAIALLEMFTHPDDISVYDIIIEEEEIVDSFFNKVKAKLTANEEAVVNLLLNKVIKQMPKEWPQAETLKTLVIAIYEDNKLKKEVNQLPFLRIKDENETYHHYVALTEALKK